MINCEQKRQGNHHAHKPNCIPKSNRRPKTTKQNLLHPLKNILTIALTGILCGYSDWVAIEDFASENQAWFASFLDLTNGIPSHDTFSNVMKRLNKDQINRYFSQWINHNAPKHKHIAIDGKFVQGSHHDNDNLQLVSAYASEAKLILAQTDINDKANEITTLPQLLSLIDIKGSTITADAMYCQKDTTKQIIKQGGNYILALKIIIKLYSMMYLCGSILSLITSN